MTMRRTLPLLATACLLAALSTMPGPATASPDDGWCYEFVCVQTCTARHEVCADPDACLRGEWHSCVDATTECLHVPGDPCGPPL